MNIHIKRLALTGASLLVALGVGVGLKSSHANASMIYEDQYPSHFNRLIPGGEASHSFYKNGYLFHAKHVLDSPGAITGIDNDYHVSKGQVERALEGKRIFKPRVRKVHHHAKRNWKLIDYENYLMDNDMVVPKPISGYWEFNRSKDSYYLASHHTSYATEAKNNNVSYEYKTNLSFAKFLKNHHLKARNLTKRIGHNRYKLDFDYADGPFYEYSKTGHPTSYIHLINHNKAYVKVYRFGKIFKTDTGYAHRISRKYFNKIAR